jgi:hypothetical protein
MSSQILPKTILINNGGTESSEMETYKDVDIYLRYLAKTIEYRAPLLLKSIVIFEDAFVWNSFITLRDSDSHAENFLQRAMKSEWEFNAGVRPEWWPTEIEAERMWGVHCREDEHNGRAELARARLDRYDLWPVVVTPLPRRKMPDR